MIKYTLLMLGCISILSLQAQNFTGKVTFEISVLEPGGNISDQKGKSVIFIKDSIVRRENDSQLGKQVYITNVNSGETTLLMNFMGQDFAIEMKKDKFSAEDSSRYAFKDQKGKEKIEGYKCKKVSYKAGGKDLEANYTDEISSIYNNGSFRHLEGFAFSYEVLDQGVVFRYICTEVLNYNESENTLSDQLFSIPPQYNQVTLQEFMQMVEERK